MANQKKTALDLACERIRISNYCPVFDRICDGYCEHDYCISKLKQYFQEQADIPDGWDVVKEKFLEYDKKYNQLIQMYCYEDSSNTSKLAMEMHEQEIEVFAIKRLTLLMLLNEAGIEVDDE